MAEEKNNKVHKKSFIDVHKKSFKDVQALNFPKEGMLTFKAEGHEGGALQTRYPHVPDKNSGITIGRGYDMSQKHRTELFADFVHAGISLEDAKKFADAANKLVKGENANEYIKKNKLEDFSLTPIQQLNLFEISHRKEMREVKRISSKKDVVKKYGKVDWDKLNPTIKEVLIDLKFRGDYKPETRKLLQKYAADNNLVEFAKVIQDKNNWKDIPPDRFKRRSEFMEEGLKKSNQNTPPLKARLLP